MNIKLFYDLSPEYGEIERSLDCSGLHLYVLRA